MTNKEFITLQNFKNVHDKLKKSSVPVAWFDLHCNSEGKRRWGANDIWLPVEYLEMDHTLWAHDRSDSEDVTTDNDIQPI